MGNAIKTVIFSFILVVLFSCDNSFLYKNNDVIYNLNDTIKILNDRTYTDLEVSLYPGVNAKYTIIQFPGWMVFSSYEGKIIDGKIFLNFRTQNIPVTTDYGFYLGILQLQVDGYGIFQIRVFYWNAGNPEMEITPRSLEIGKKQEVSFTIKNTTDGLLFLELTDLPEWLSLSSTRGMVSSYGSVTIFATVNREGMDPGIYQDSFLIKSNYRDSVVEVPVSMEVSEAGAGATGEIIEGEVTDAEYRKSTNTLLICTKQPNRLIVYNTNDDTKQIISLDKTPACVSFSPDGKHAAVGYNLAEVSKVDLVNMQIENSVEIDIIPFDIVYGENDWCYVTPYVDQWTNLRNVNLSSGETVIGKRSIYEKTKILKQPGKDFLIGTCFVLSPGGFYLFKINDDNVVNDTIAEVFVSTNGIWLSEDGAKIYCGTGRVYKTPDYDDWKVYSGASYSSIAIFEEYPGTIKWIEQNETTDRLYVSESYYDNTPSVIKVFNASNYNFIKEIPVAGTFVDQTLYTNEVIYLFSNKEGTRMFMIKKDKEGYDKTNNIWSFDVIEVE